MTLVEFLVGISVGLLVVLAALGSMTLIYSSAHTLNDSAQLEQQATLVMAQIGQQIKQANAINAYNLAAGNPNYGLPSDGGVSASSTLPTAGMSNSIVFDTRPIGVCINYKTKGTGSTISFSPGCAALTVFGEDGDSKMAKDGSSTALADTLYISYAVPNDSYIDSTKNLYEGNCIGSKKSLSVPLPTNSPLGSYGPVPQVTSQFYIKPTTDTDGSATGDLMCGDGNNSPQPIAHNVIDMKISYLGITSNGDVMHYRTGNDVSSNGQVMQNWNKVVNGLEICLTLRGEPTQAPKTAIDDCHGNALPNDGRIYRVVTQRFYLQNNG